MPSNPRPYNPPRRPSTPYQSGVRTGAAILPAFKGATDWWKQNKNQVLAMMGVATVQRGQTPAQVFNSAVSQTVEAWRNVDNLFRPVTQPGNKGKPMREALFRLDPARRNLWSRQQLIDQRDMRDDKWNKGFWDMPLKYEALPLPKGYNEDLPQTGYDYGYGYGGGYGGGYDVTYPEYEKQTYPSDWYTRLLNWNVNR